VQAQLVPCAPRRDAVREVAFLGVRGAALAGGPSSFVTGPTLSTGREERLQVLSTPTPLRSGAGGTRESLWVLWQKQPCSEAHGIELTVVFLCLLRW